MTPVRDQLLEMLKAVATALGEDLRERLVFVGGCTTALFITDPVTLEDVRATDDIDLIVDLTGLAEWAQLLEELRGKGFTEAADEAVICRMRLGPLKVDFMPDDEAILGFSNRWYAMGINTATQHQLSEDIAIPRDTPKPKPENFHWIEWDQTSLLELSGHLSFMTKWYYKRREIIQAADKRRNLLLVVIGVVALALLLTSAAAKDLTVPPQVGTAFALALWSPVLYIMVKTWFEDRTLRSWISMSKKPKDTPKPSPVPFRGVYYAVANHVRRTHSDKVSPLARAASLGVVDPSPKK